MAFNMKNDGKIPAKENVLFWEASAYAADLAGILDKIVTRVVDAKRRAESHNICQYTKPVKGGMPDEIILITVILEAYSELEKEV